MTSALFMTSTLFGAFGRLTGLSAQIARRGASVRPDQLAGNWSFVAFARLHLLEGMGERADRARQHEQAPAQRRREAELGEDHAGRAVDVHRDRPPLIRRELSP